MNCLHYSCSLCNKTTPELTISVLNILFVYVCMCKDMCHLMCQCLHVYNHVQVVWLYVCAYMCESICVHSFMHGNVCIFVRSAYIHVYVNAYFMSVCDRYI